MKIPVKAVAHALSRDIDPDRQEDVKKLDGFVNKCLSAATEALTKRPLKGYSELEIGHLLGVVDGLRHSHFSIRHLLVEGDKKARAVDALAIARLQLETLFSICLMLQDVQYLRDFVKSTWKTAYTRFLLQREECAALPRFSEYLNATAGPMLDKFRVMSGVTEAEKLTIEHEEIGAAIPPGFVLEKIAQFPTPRRVIDKITNTAQKEMLKRLYPEYQYLCSFAHGSPDAWMLKAILDERSIYRRFFTSGEIEDRFQRGVGEPAILYSVLSGVQAAAEIAAHYPANVELLAALGEAWSFLADRHLLVMAIWERRTRALLKVVGI